MKHNTIDKNKNTRLTNARYKTKTIKRDKDRTNFEVGNPGLPVTQVNLWRMGMQGSGTRAGRTSTGQEGGVKGEREGEGGVIQELQVQV